MHVLYGVVEEALEMPKTRLNNKGPCKTEVGLIDEFQHDVICLLFSGKLFGSGICVAGKKML